MQRANQGRLSTDDFSRESICIEHISPELDCGRFPVKRIVGDSLKVSADVVKSGHDVLRADLLYRKKAINVWSRTPMQYDDDEDRWNASFLLKETGTYEYAIEAWVDKYLNLVESTKKWFDSGENILTELDSLNDLIESAIAASPADLKSRLSRRFEEIQKSNTIKAKLQLAEDREFAELVNSSLEKPSLQTSIILEVAVEPTLARFGSWYEMFHRSQGNVPRKSATFADCEKRLPEIRKMGFDVIYLPPIHPIGRTNRRSRNNSGDAGPDDPGSPWAIGNENGGHKSINPDLGTMEDFLHFVCEAKKLDMEVALDLAYQASPDHPYVREHPEWFYHQKDGTIRYAENPPKKYYDIVPFSFENKNWKQLWEELLKVVIFWIEKGVRIFRVDNPHTKPIGFWEWLISSVKSSYPDTIFLAEAFTRPKSMKLLAKLGFSQSYTYFTWKNTKRELEQFLDEFVLSDVSEYYIGNFFTNTPDILSEYLQKGGRPAFKIRLVLAATLSSSYGIYNGFELCENRALTQNSEDYLNSEKYEYKVWDWERPSNIKDFISKVNKIRRENAALQFTSNLRLLRASNENVMFYAKWTQDKRNVIMVAVNLDPFNTQDSTVYVPVKELGVENQSYFVWDLITGKRFEWRGETNYIRLDPNIEPAHILLLEK